MWPHVSISTQKGIVRVASHTPRLAAFLKCAGAVWVAKCKHFQNKGIVRVAICPPRVEGSRECARSSLGSQM